MSESDHRAYRFGATLPAILLYEGDELACDAENFSRSGLLLTGRSDWPATDSLKLVLRSATGDLQIPLAVRVVRRIPRSESAGAKLAVEFVQLDQATREALEFLLQRVIEGHGKAPSLPEIPPGARPHEIRKVLDSLPLATRISLAARGGPKEREHLVHDQHPAVLEALARNPNLLPADARGLAASIHATTATLMALVAEGRFVADEELRVLVLSHARVPPAIVERVAATLGVLGLRRALAKSSLTTVARTVIQKRLLASERRS